MKPNEKAIYYFLEAKYKDNENDWFNVREIAQEIDLSIHRTRRHLTILVLKNKLETKINKFWNVYRFKP